MAFIGYKAPYLAPSIMNTTAERLADHLLFTQVHAPIVLNISPERVQVLRRRAQVERSEIHKPPIRD
ncbi:MAG TPA: hypothetical protein VJC18_00705, partial [bacterium]|nr:hypothetical protein [bacterium]